MGRPESSSTFITSLTDSKHQVVIRIVSNLASEVLIEAFVRSVDRAKVARHRVNKKGIFLFLGNLSVTMRLGWSYWFFGVSPLGSKFYRIGTECQHEKG